MASASLGGVWLTSFVIAASNTAIALVILHGRISARVIAAAVALACAGLGPALFWLGPSPPAGSTLRVALVQPGNIEDSVVRQAAGEALTAALAGRRLDLVVWGESSVGVDLTGQPEAMTRLMNLSRRVGADLLVNVDARDRQVGSTSRRCSSVKRSSRLVFRRGWCRSGEYVPLGRCSAGLPGTQRLRPRTDVAAADRWC
jgi:apolipoprotein N-acyltransferase